MGGFIASRAGRFRSREARQLLASRPARFVIVGGTCFATVVLLFEALRHALPLPFAATIAYGLGAIASYELNRTWTFGLRSRDWAQAGRSWSSPPSPWRSRRSCCRTFVATWPAPDVAMEILALLCIAPLTFRAYGRWGFAPMGKA